MFGLSEETITVVQKVLSKFPKIEKAVIYGSRAEGTYKDGSDIDITLFGKELDNTLSALSVALNDLRLPYEFDLSIFENTDCPKVIDRINKFGKNFLQKTKVNLLCQNY